MKFLKSIWTVVGLSLIISAIILFAVMQLALNGIKEDIHANRPPDLTPVPDRPIQYPDNLTEDIKAFVLELEKRDEKIRGREEDLENIRASIRQEKEEFENHKNEILNLQAEFDKKVQDFQKRRIFLEEKEFAQMKDLAATIEGLSPAAAVALFLQMNKDEFATQSDGSQPMAATGNAGLALPGVGAPKPEIKIPDLTVLGILELMDPKDIAPIFEEMTGGKEATDETRALAGALAQHLRRLVVESKPGNAKKGG
jgi:hypothetical protein